MPFVSWTIQEDDESLKPSKLTTQEINRATKEFSITTGGENFLTGKGFPDVPSAIQQTLLRAEISTPKKNLRKVLKIALGSEEPSRVSLSQFIEVLGYLKALTKVRITTSSSEDEGGQEEESEDDDEIHNPLINNLRSQLDENTFLKKDEDWDTFRETGDWKKKQYKGSTLSKNDKKQQQQNSKNSNNRTSTNDTKGHKKDKNDMMGKSAIDILKLQALRMEDDDEDDDVANDNGTSPSTTSTPPPMISIVTSTENNNTRSPTTTTTASNKPSFLSALNNNNNDEGGGTKQLVRTSSNLSRQTSFQFEAQNSQSDFGNVFNNSRSDFGSYYEEDTGGTGGGAYHSGGGGARRRSSTGSVSSGAGGPLTPQPRRTASSKFATRKRFEVFESSMTDIGAGATAAPDMMSTVFQPIHHTNNNNNINQNAFFEQSVKQPRHRNRQFMFSESAIQQIQGFHGIGFVDRYKLRAGDFQSTVTQRKLKDVLHQHRQTVARVKRDQYHMAVHGMGGTLMDERKPFKTHQTNFDVFKFDPPLEHQPIDLPLFVHGRPVPQKIRDIEEQRRIQAVRCGEIEGAGRSRLRCKTCTPERKPNRFDVAAGRTSPSQLDLVSIEKRKAREDSKRRLSVLGFSEDGTQLFSSPQTQHDNNNDDSSHNNSTGVGDITVGKSNFILDDKSSSPASKQQQQQQQHVSFASNSPLSPPINSTPPKSQQHHQSSSTIFSSPTKLPPVMTKSLKAAAVAKVYGERW